VSGDEATDVEGTCEAHSLHVVEDDGEISEADSEMEYEVEMEVVNLESSWATCMRMIWAASCIWFMWNMVELILYKPEGRVLDEVELNVMDVDSSGDVTMEHGSKKMRKIPKGILVDSGAGASVADGDQFPEFMREESAGSRRGQQFLGPGSERIPNRGQKKVSVMTQSGIKSKITFQDSPVRRPILAVSDSTKAGNLVCFDQDESVIIPRDSEEGMKIREVISKARRKVTLELEQGVYQIPAWVVAPENDKKEIDAKNTRQGR